MSSPTSFNRPTLNKALDAWKQLLAARGLSSDLRWIFEENLCFEKSSATPGGFHLGFQTKFSPPPEDALDTAFEHFSETDKRMVFFRLGHNLGKSICVLLCDPWFENKGEADGFLRRDEWRVSFHPGPADEIEEITDLGRWLRRVKHGRAFHDLDFSMTLAAIDEIKTHGRVLMPYERFASTMLNRLRRFLGQPA
ncbi:MAG TPA: hypothetical protein VMA35_04160 [Candidatus Sulfopaludibacter sp.]|nr:hypothetical protein [Candidatus Sulfopaludibacter sp.]